MNYKSKFEWLDKIEAEIPPQRVNGIGDPEKVKEFRAAMLRIIDIAKGAIEYADQRLEQMK